MRTGTSFEAVRLHRNAVNYFSFRERFRRISMTLNVGNRRGVLSFNKREPSLLKYIACNSIVQRGYLGKQVCLPGTVEPVNICARLLALRRRLKVAIGPEKSTFEAIAKVSQGLWVLPLLSFPFIWISDDQIQKPWGAIFFRL